MTRRGLALVWLTLALVWCVGILGRGYWTPDEPREADIAWRMSWQPHLAVPLLAGEPFCEKPPMTYWAAGLAMAVGGTSAWVARLPNLLYAVLTALAVGWIGRRAHGPIAGVAAAAAMSTFLLSYQVAIWLATDAPLLAAVSLALAGLYAGFYAADGRARLRGYCCMHAAMACGFLCKSAAAWMVPSLALLTLVIWERRWREVLRPALYAGLAIQAAFILTWVGFVYAGADGVAHLKVFFWNNLVGRFAAVDAPQELQYAAAHRNTPGKYLLELPAYLWPWTLLAVAAARCAWRARAEPPATLRGVRFALAAFVPTLAVLSIAATARNIYLAPALPGLALLLGWWLQRLDQHGGRWDANALRISAAMLCGAALLGSAAAILIGSDSWQTLALHAPFVVISGAGLVAAAVLSVAAWRAVDRRRWLPASLALFLAYGSLLIGPASQAYRAVDTWQDLGAIGRDMRRDAATRPLILFAPDETTRAFIDMYTRPTVRLITGPVTPAATERLHAALAVAPDSLVVAQLDGRASSRVLQQLEARFGLRRSGARGAEPPPWAAALHLRIAHYYALPNGRRYALLESGSTVASR